VLGSRIISTILLSTSLLAVSSPLVGELAATIPPIFLYGFSSQTDALGIPYEEVTFPTTDGLILRGWLFPAGKQDAPAIIYAPATSRDQRSGLSLVRPLHEAGYHVLLFSYRGHGRSDGNRTGFTYGAKESKDVDAAVSYLHDARDIHRIGAIGHSAGAASIIISAARNRHIGAVVAVAPFATLEEVWETNRPALIPKFVLDLTMRFSEFRKGFCRCDVRPQDLIARISPRPLLLVHGSDDRRITQEQAYHLFALAERPKQMWLVEGANHSEVRNPVLDELIPEIIEFLDESLIGGSRLAVDPFGVGEDIAVENQAPQQHLATLDARGWQRSTVGF